MLKDLTYTSELRTPPTEIISQFLKVLNGFWYEGCGNITSTDTNAISFAAKLKKSGLLATPQFSVRIVTKPLDEETTSVFITFDYNPRYRIVSLVSVFLGALLAYPSLLWTIYAIAVDRQMTDLIAWLLLPTAIGTSMLSVGATTEMAVHHLRLNIEKKLWDSVNAGERGKVIAVADGNEPVNAVESFIMLGLMLAFVIVVLRVGGHQREAGYVGVFLAAPLILVTAANLIAQDLPLRFRWRSQYASLAVIWYLVMFLPLMLTVSTTHIWPNSDHSLSKLMNLVFEARPLAALGILIGEVLVVIAMKAEVMKAHVRYASMLGLPSAGKETPGAGGAKLKVYQAIVAAAFTAVSIGSALAIMRLWSKSEPRTLLEVCVFFPLLLFLTSTLRRISLRICQDFRDALNPEDGRAVLDHVTRVGFYDELKTDLRARRLLVRRRDHALFGASIRRLLWAPRTFAVVLEPRLFSALRASRQREAVLWHEAGHAKESTLTRFVELILFHLWYPLFRAAVHDSFDSELRADAYSASKMSDPAPLADALAALQRTGSGSRLQKETVNDGLRLILRSLVGDNNVGYWHPHVAIRSEVLAALRKDRESANSVGLANCKVTT